MEPCKFCLILDLLKDQMIIIIMIIILFNKFNDSDYYNEGSRSHM